jgi:peptidyl-prolyl cis-trans isomerase C
MHLMITLATVLVLADASGQAPAAPSSVVLRTGNVAVSSAELLDAMREARLSGDPKRILDTMTSEGLERMARAILERKLLARAARVEGLDKKPDVSRAVTRAVETLLAGALLEQDAAGLDTSDAALRGYYDGHQAAFRTAPRRKAHHIVVRTRGEAEAALADLNAGKAFEEVARARNIDSSRASGGDLGWVPLGLMVRPFDQALFALDQPGQVSAVVETNFGSHVIKVDEIDPGQLPPFDTIKDKVKQAMVDAAVARRTADLTGRNPATVNKEALAALATGGKR